MATAKLKAAPAPAAAAGAPPPKKSKMLLIVIAVVVVALAGGGGGAWLFLRAKSHDAPPAEHAAPVKKPPVFVTLEPFVVNLIPENGDHYLQIGLVYQVIDDKAVDIYGNEVSNAVAEYSLDVGGGSYELHSPQTDIPHLGSPES